MPAGTTYPFATSAQVAGAVRSGQGQPAPQPTQAPAASNPQRDAVNNMRARMGLSPLTRPVPGAGGLVNSAAGVGAAGVGMASSAPALGPAGLLAGKAASEIGRFGSRVDSEVGRFQDRLQDEFKRPFEDFGAEATRFGRSIEGMANSWMPGVDSVGGMDENTAKRHAQAEAAGTMRIQDAGMSGKDWLAARREGLLSGEGFNPTSVNRTITDPETGEQVAAPAAWQNDPRYRGLLESAGSRMGGEGQTPGEVIRERYGLPGVGEQRDVQTIQERRDQDAAEGKEIFERKLEGPEMPESFSDRTAALLDPSSNAMKRAADVGYQLANKRGLLNSSAGVQAASGAMMDRAMQLAKGDSEMAMAAFGMDKQAQIDFQKSLNQSVSQFRQQHPWAPQSTINAFTSGEQSLWSLNYTPIWDSIEIDFGG